MASSSSAKKVARVAAKSGSGKPAGASSGSGRNWMFGIGIVLIIALGAGVVAMARSENEGLGSNTTPPKANLQNGDPFDHWHAAFAVEVCGTQLDPVPQKEPDVQGIHTHGDGLIHIHPFTERVAGPGATLGVFFDQVGIQVTDDGFTDQTGRTFRAGETTCGGEPTELVLLWWRDARSAADTPPDEVITSGFADVRFTEDGAAYTLALRAVGGTSPAPSSAAEIAELGAVDGTPADPEVPVTTR